LPNGNTKAAAHFWLLAFVGVYAYAVDILSSTISFFRPVFGLSTHQTKASSNNTT
jgi:hypothetical protein